MVEPLGANVLIEVLTQQEEASTSGIILKSEPKVTIILKLAAIGPECEQITAEMIGREVHVKTGQFSGIQEEDGTKYMIGTEKGILGLVV